MATIGGAALEPADFSAEAVYRNADFALYHAKETGRGGFVRYWPGIGTRITQRRDAIRDVSAALSDGRIETYYQPAIALDCREILGVEALCRLKTRSGQIVAAHLFQEATSDASVATALTGRMLESVAQDLRGWMDDGIPVRHVGINVSAADFRSGRLMNQLDESFGRAGVPFDRLILEVSESIYTDQRDKVMEREIAALRERGIVVALDDFGTDYASLTRLMRVPIDAIKIDQSFVARLWPGDPSTIIVQGLIDIAREMDIAVVAKGIETEVQASQLWAMGCRVGQGFAFSQVHDRKTTTELLRRHAHGLRNAIPLYRDRPGQPGQAAAQKSELRPTGTV
jgi:EAL domain-containing protein (putative c-di-GMP-specific phosphodiesterase class I)